MRRYGVRFLVAVLTFGLGVAFSMFLGLFRFPEFAPANRYTLSNGCRKARVARAPLLRVDTELSDPLKLSYLGPSSSQGMKLLVENRRDQTISGFSVTGKRLWSTGGTHGETAFTWDSSDSLWNSDGVLRPGENLVINLPRNTDGLAVLVDEVTFESGFTWINPRVK
jgi:hypothetical protein